MGKILEMESCGDGCDKSLRFVTSGLYNLSRPMGKLIVAQYNTSFLALLEVVSRKERKGFAKDAKCGAQLCVPWRILCALCGKF